MNTYQFTVEAYNREDDNYQRVILGEANGENKEIAFQNLVKEKQIDTETIEDEMYKMGTVRSSIVNFETKEMEDKDIDYEYLARESEIEILKDTSEFYDWLMDKAKEELETYDVESLYIFVMDSLNTDDEGMIDDFRMGY